MGISFESVTSNWKYVIKPVYFLTYHGVKTSWLNPAAFENKSIDHENF